MYLLEYARRAHFAGPPVTTRKAHFGFVMQVP